jgi:uncharacterized protein YacL
MMIVSRLGFALASAWLGWQLGTGLGMALGLGIAGFLLALEIGIARWLVKETAVPVKVLDLSSIVDGRIEELCKLEYLDGKVVIPQHVIHELRVWSEHSDTMKKNRGRSGLDMLQRLKRNLPGRLVIVPDPKGVEFNDEKLIRLAKRLRGRIVTNDVNVARLARLQAVSTLNLNALSNALKVNLLAGEIIQLKVIKPGKEADQGVGYLDDGTMVVVEHGRVYIEKTIYSKVTSVLQTPAGRLVFVRPLEEESEKKA